jgi:acyl-CoA dehydrogenase
MEADPRIRRGEGDPMPLASLIGRWAMQPFSKALPPLGDTERAALEAGTVGFEGQLFAGRPDFRCARRHGAQPVDGA